ncbi:MAG: hypothetical protein JW839_13370 [Candidatus Lokiarchaeota archaeon]|nr:hypothetical protein [Candidatus Lokiarchaeota archaeon]
MGYDIHGVIYVAQSETFPYLLPARKELHAVAAVLAGVGIIEGKERARLDAAIDTMEEGDNPGDIDSTMLIFPEFERNNGWPIEIPYRVRSKKAFPHFYSRSIVDGSWGEMEPNLVQRIEVFYRGKDVAPTGAIPDRSRLFIARVNYEGGGGDVWEEKMLKKFAKDKVLSSLRAGLDSALHVAPGSTRIALVAV